jgi:dUTP pyrophosphatase
MNIKIKKTNGDALTPTHGSEFAAGYDLYSVENFELFPNQRHLFETGIIMEIPIGYYGRISPRSGLSFKNGIDVMGGIIDCDYRNSIKVLLINLSSEPFIIEKGSRIAQIIIQPCYYIDFIECDELSDTQRNVGGFGSTGK